MERSVNNTSDDSPHHVGKKYAEQFNEETFLTENPLLVHMLRAETSLRSAREVLWEWLTRLQFKYYSEGSRADSRALKMKRRQHGIGRSKEDRQDSCRWH